ncbi:MAG: xanthine dehydrogenase family protein subunit M, partial [Actinobacteria bacterium]|nr:xanthine dehydrogenase family protein subunit M [Actinomycetota bacterium]
MIPASFDYEVADSVEAAVELLGRDDAKALAGGHSLIPAMKLRVARPSLLVDLSRLDLSYVRDDGTHVAVGALTRHKEVRDARLIREHCAIVGHAAGLIGDPQVRHRGTIGGSLAHGDPASDLPAVMLAVGAELVAQGAAGTRAIAADDFFTGVFETALAPDELLIEVRLPKLAATTGWSYVKLNRRAQDWATVGVAALLHRSGDRIDAARVGLVNMGATALRARGVEDALTAGDPVGRAAARVG